MGYRRQNGTVEPVSPAKSGIVFPKIADVKYLIDEYILALTVVFFALGITFAYFCHGPEKLNLWLVILPVIFIIFFLLLAVGKKLPWFMLVAAFLVGSLYYSLDMAALNSLPDLTGRQVKVRGYVSRILDKPAKDEDNGSFILKPDNKKQWPGFILVYGDTTDLHYGDILLVSGKVLQTPSAVGAGEFDYQAYLLRQDIVGRVSARYGGSIERISADGGYAFMRLASCLRERLEAAIAPLPFRQAAFVSGILLGDKSLLLNEERNVLSQTGITHVFAVSGLHVGFVALLAAILAQALHLSRRWGVLLGVPMVFLYAGITGFTPSVTRAAVMFAVGALAYFCWEGQSPFTAWCMALFVILLWRPAMLFDVGLQLSFAAVAGLIFTTGFWQKLLPHVKFLQVTFAAQMAVMPLLAYYFGVFTVIGFILSPLAVLVAGVVVMSGILSLPFGLIGLPTLPLYLPGLLSQLLYVLAQKASFLPGAWLGISNTALWQVVLCYLLLILACIMIYRLHGRLKAVALLLIFVTVLAGLPYQKPDGLRVTFLDVGQGSSILVETKSGKNLLIDGGGSDNDLEWAGESVVVPYLYQHRIKYLDYMICTHPHADHAGGLLTVLKNLKVGQVLLTNNFTAELQDELLQTAAAAKAPWQNFYAGSMLTIEPGLTLKSLWPKQDNSYEDENANEGSLVLLLSYKNMNFLLTGDLTGDGFTCVEDELLLAGCNVDVLQVPHHGSLASFDISFNNALHPQIVATGVGENNIYGFPAAEIVKYWQVRQVPFYRTDLNGNIVISTDGQSLQVTTDK